MLLFIILIVILLICTVFLINRPRVLVLQTCDGIKYKDIADLSESVNRKYANRHGYDYKRFDGIKRGRVPWHATFNRIYLIDEEIERGYYDWVIYIDVDAIVVDHSKSIEDFFDNKYGLIACRGASDDPEIFWDINAGVLIYNLRNLHTKQIISRWKAEYEKFSIENLSADGDAVFEGGGNRVCDQGLLSSIIRSMGPGIVKVYRGDEHNAFNYDGPFIKQILRTSSNGIDSRLDKMRKVIETLKI